MKKSVIFFFAGIIVLFLSCTPNNKEASSSTQVSAFSADVVTLNKSTKNDVPQDYERKITKTGSLSFETSSIDKTKEQIYTSVTALKGYISSDNISTYNQRKENTLIIRIPSENFDKLLAVISKNALKIDDQNVQILDVTEEFIDLDKRIKTKKELEQRYIQLLQKASKVEEILKIEEQIGNLRADIESTEGKLKYLNNQINFSTLTVTFYEKHGNFGFWYKLSQGFKNGWDNILWVFVGIANMWAIILFGVSVFLLIRYFRRQLKKKKTSNN